jgi:hypothetical protein
MILKPQDVLVLLKLVAIEKKHWSFNTLAVELGMSPSEVHAAVRRSVSAGLALRNDDIITPNISNLREFLLHGLKYVFAPDRGGLTRGVPTRYAAPPLSELLVQSNEPPPVWPDPEGKVRGEAFTPLYKSVPKAIRKDKKLYELLVLVDAVRGGSAREQEIAVKKIEKRLQHYNEMDNYRQGEPDRSDSSGLVS